jgi:CRP/FNR family transcriptional regulator, cyclic AMP receptor protein
MSNITALHPAKSLSQAKARSFSLRAFPVFASLDEDDDRHWSQYCQQRTFGPGETLVDFGDPTRDVFLVQTGQFRAVFRFAIGKEAILGTFREGDIFGELSAIDGQPRSASLMAIFVSTVIVVPAEVFTAIVVQKPDVALTLLKLLSNRIRLLSSRVTDLSFLDTKHRLYNTLLRLSRSRPRNRSANADANPDERVISPPVIHAELADHIGSSRETVSREMARLIREGLIERTASAIILKKPGELSARISSALEG